MFSVLSASGCAFKAAASVDVLRAVLAGLALVPAAFAEEALPVEALPVAFGKTDLDNTDVVRDHSFHCIANAESSVHWLHYIMWG